MEGSARRSDVERIEAGGRRVATIPKPRPAADRGRPLRRLTLVHTHPVWTDPEEGTAVICPSTADYAFGRLVRRAWEETRAAGEIEVVGIVLPDHSGCTDLFFRFEPDDLIPRGIGLVE